MNLMPRLRVFLSVGDARTYIVMNEAVVKQLYIKQGLTAKVTAERLGIHPNQAWAKALNAEMPKGAGHGGTRQGSGMKKGTILCKTCLKKKCVCPSE